MIFVTIGAQNPFDRLVRTADEMASRTDEQVVIQYGASRHIPTHGLAFDFMPIERIREYCLTARVIVMHAGVGSLLTALEFPAQLVLVPRRKRFQEAIDDHQLELAEILEQRGQVAYLREVTPEALLDAINRAPVRQPGWSGREQLPGVIERRVAQLLGRSGAATAHSTLRPTEGS